MELIPVDNIDQCQKGDDMFISGHGDIQKHYTVQLRKESDHDGVEIIIDRKLNKYFNLGMYLKGESWVKELYIVKK